MAANQKALELPVKIQRFNLQQRFQHAGMAISVLMLIITGFPIKYAAQDWAQYAVNLFGGFENMFHVHLAFGVIMILCALYHVIWLAYSFVTSRNKERKPVTYSPTDAFTKISHEYNRGPDIAMMPSYKDVRDAIQHIQYLLGLRPDPPQFDRYTWLEKFEYFAVIWGVIVMGFSGIMLWFPQLFVFWPRWALDVGRVVHTNEAFVAMLALVVGHFFAAHFSPKVFPTSRVWWDGTINREHLKEEHPLEYDRLVQEYKAKGMLVPDGEGHSPFSQSLPLMVVELIIYVAIFILLLWTFIPMLLV
ncbi:MAG: cytochrome b/b6 domain-containing protein [Clostridia bacterium]|nr:MAG: cytochrome b/b6 domain-containing protein [Clostridia bacterium]